MAHNDPIPEADELIRWLHRNFIEKDDDGQPVRTSNGLLQNVDPRAFALREGEEYLSVTWVNYFKDERLIAIPAAAEAFRESLDSKRIPATSGFAVANNGVFKRACKAAGESVRVLEEPEDENPAHVAVRRFPRENMDLLNELSTNVYAESYTYSEIKSWVAVPPICTL